MSSLFRSNMVQPDLSQVDQTQSDLAALAERASSPTFGQSMTVPQPQQRKGFDWARALGFFGGLGPSIIAADTQKAQTQAAQTQKMVDAAAKELGQIYKSFADRVNTVSGTNQATNKAKVDFSASLENLKSIGAKLTGELALGYMRTGRYTQSQAESLARSQYNASVAQAETALQRFTTFSEAQTTQGTGAGKAKTAESQTTGVPVPGSTEALQQRPGDVVDYMNPATGEKRSIRASDTALTNALLKAGWLKVPLSVSATNPNDLGVQKSELKDFRASMIATKTVLNETARIRQQLKNSDTVTGLMGGVVTGLNSLVGTLRQGAKQFNLNDESLLNVNNYDWITAFPQSAPKTNAFRSNITGLAYAMARAADPGARLSDKDVQIQIDRIGANLGDKQSILAQLDEVDRSAKAHMRITANVLGQPVPQDMQEQQQPTSMVPPRPAGVTDDDLRAKAKLAIQRGQDRTVILERLRAWGVPTAGLE